MAAFNYDAEAELFPGAARPHRGQPLGYRRFASVAEALRFAMEELSPGSLAGAALEVGDERFDSHGMQELYEASEYPLARRERTHRSSATAGRRPQGGGSLPGSGVAREGRANQGSKLTAGGLQSAGRRPPAGGALSEVKESGEGQAPARTSPFERGPAMGNPKGTIKDNGR